MRISTSTLPVLVTCLVTAQAATNFLRNCPDIIADNSFTLNKNELDGTTWYEARRITNFAEDPLWIFHYKCTQMLLELQGNNELFIKAKHVMDPPVPGITSL